MSDELLSYYNRELTFIRRMGAEFAAANPKIAGRLRLGTDAVEDPHVARMVEAFAYLNARIRHKLDDDFPELTDALLGVLYPHYLAPIPSMAIVQFEPQADLSAGYLIPRGASVETDPIHGEPCRFRTCYPVTVWPVQIESASLAGRPLVAPRVPASGEAQAVLRIVLRCAAPDASFDGLAPDSLRFFLKGQAQHVYPLYELLLNNALQVVIAEAADDPRPTVMGPDCLRGVGFDADEGMLPYPPRSFAGYRLLSEFFAFPEKFLFVELTGLAARLSRPAGNRLEIFIYCDRSVPELERNVSAEILALGCTPVVNLHRQRAEPIQLSHMRSEYRVVPDARRPASFEVYSVDRVTASDSAGRQFKYLPFYGLGHGKDGDSVRTFWHASRRPGGPRDSGTEVFLSLVDLDFSPSASAGQYLSVETTCLNRDLPERLPFGGGEPRLQLGEGGAPLRRIVCQTPPTPTLRPSRGHGALWKLVSHLTLNHLSITDGQEGTDALKEILRLYDVRDSAETRAMIDGIMQVTSRAVTGRAPTRGPAGFCRGTEVAIQFDEGRFAGSGLFLFASVLERFLALYCSINSFIRLTATVKGREGKLRQWTSRAGDLRLL